MLSGIQSLFFGKKHKHRQDDSTDDKSQVSTDNDFVILERRHSDEYDRNSGLYPSFDSSLPHSNLPYAISPSLPNLKDATSGSESPKEETKLDMLQGVPFVLSSQLMLLEDRPSGSLHRVIRSIRDMKDSEESFFDGFNYDFELEQSVSSEFSDS